MIATKIVDNTHCPNNILNLRVKPNLPLLCSEFNCMYLVFLNTFFCHRKQTLKRSGFLIHLDSDYFWDSVESTILANTVHLSSREGGASSVSSSLIKWSALVL